MADIRTLLDALVEAGPGKKIEVANIGDENEYHTIRTALVKRWADYKEVLLAMSDDDAAAGLSLCGDWHGDRHAASFFLGKSRRKQPRSYSFVVVSTVHVDGPQRIPSGIADDNSTDAS